MSGRVYAFVTFPDIDVAHGFMDQNFPSIRLGAAKGERSHESAMVNIVYSRQGRERHPGPDRESEWICAEV